jgi:hypothetical protein
MTNEELITRISDVAYDYGHDICYLAADRIEQLQSKLAKATDALKEILFFSNEDDIVGWLDALARAQALMTELEN